jgi:hypothetical protein
MNSVVTLPDRALVRRSELRMRQRDIMEICPTYRTARHTLELLAIGQEVAELTKTINARLDEKIRLEELSKRGRAPHEL